MKYLITLISSLLFFLNSYSQVAENCYRLFLTDKNNTEFSIYNPGEFLSQESINRRINQGINITENDLPVSNEYIDSLKSLGLKVLTKSKWFNSVIVYSTNLSLIDTITQLGFIKSKQQNYSSITSSSLKNSLQRKNLTQISETYYPDYGSSGIQISMLNGHVLHRSGYSGSGMTIAVIDAGFYNVDILPAFDSLWINNQILGVKDFVDNDNQVFDAPSHGMKVLSIMGGNLPGELIGSAPKANYWLLRSEDNSSEQTIEEDYWVAAAEFADSVGVDIINSSLGYTEFDISDQNYTYSDLNGNTTIITKAADIAASKGILVISSAGNLGDDPWKYISAPADGDSVLTVGAVDFYANYAYFSGIGPTSDGRIKPNIAAIGLHTVLMGIDGNVTTGNGTSFSAPLISGLAACLWESSPELTNMEIFKKIEKSAHHYSNPDYNMGYGIPDFGKASGITSSGISILEENTIVRIYPNPFYSEINIELFQKTKNQFTIELFSITGEKLFESEKFSANYGTIKLSKNLENLPSGIYLLKISTKNDAEIRRICKSK
ncbi:MAG: S8 family serine peptidase [Bacteroidales bacterium]|nr:S8 family serine peptidase [Bacteroidales bacterium]